MPTLDPEDTIAAIASPPGPSARGLVRLSGPSAWSIVAGVVRFDEGPASPHGPLRQSCFVDLDGATLAASVALWRAPRTFTGQEMAEIQAVGAPSLLRAVLAACLRGGARLAEPGEFTLRAFLAGRIDLTRAEAVLAVIDSQSESQVRSALAQLAGGLAEPIEGLRDHLLDVLAHVEAGLDFVDEADVDPIGRRSLADDLETAAAEVAALAGRMNARDRPVGSPRVVLVGPPNAGKSRLFNALVGADHAIVSPVAGTTRDYLAAPCRCDGLIVDLIDTAGVEAAADPIAAEAQAHRDAQAAGADLLIDCRSFDAKPAVEPPDGRPRLVVWTKADRSGPPAGTIATSAEAGTGLDDLRRAIAGSLRDRSAESSPPELTSARCGDGLRRAAEGLRRASEAIRLDGGDELIAIDLRDAIDELGRVVGLAVDDEVLDRIFRRFCIGK